jgi:hypothetical protein
MRDERKSASGAHGVLSFGCSFDCTHTDAVFSRPRHTMSYEHKWNLFCGINGQGGHQLRVTVADHTQYVIALDYTGGSTGFELAIVISRSIRGGISTVLEPIPHFGDKHLVDDIEELVRIMCKDAPMYDLVTIPGNEPYQLSASKYTPDVT